MAFILRNRSSLKELDFTPGIEYRDFGQETVETLAGARPSTCGPPRTWSGPAEGSPRRPAPG